MTEALNISEDIEKVIESTMPEEVKRISQEDWLAKGKRLFGEDPREWQVECACCGNVQTMNDFIKLRELGIYEGDAQIAFSACIGRYDTRIPKDKIGRLDDEPTDGKPKSPCDYTCSGLIRLAKTLVIDGDGDESAVFEFATDGGE